MRTINPHLQRAKHFLLFATPAIAGSVLAVSPSYAATFATSQGESLYINFSQKPFLTDSVADTDTLAVSKQGLVNAFADAQAGFLTEPSFASTSSLSTALGETRNYLGLAKSETIVRGFFNVEANTPFRFDFTANLDLETSIDNPPGENARAAGDIFLALVDTERERVLDFFSLVGNLNTLGDDDFLALDKSENITFLEPESEYNYSFGGNNEFITASVKGSLNREITQDTVLALVEIRRNQAKVQAPEPSSILALLAPSAVVSLVLKGKRKGKSLESSSESKVSAEV
ncbi:MULTISPECIES: hypothetical protein [Nostocales]|uniref:PEP-CTERM sorting domain-containing protein n=3 Tax=Nostocales TaxID=1161 RepID=A0A0C1N557_9CYAN|nr:hypothetical protein [Tolypothrix bouteillei]KAF3888920.1 hypothetical protein DA73_0400028125 [Tolypothrix bouteillei VB521301]